MQARYARVLRARGFGCRSTVRRRDVPYGVFCTRAAAEVDILIRDDGGCDLQVTADRRIPPIPTVTMPE